jgi:hypothetical protein
MINSSLQSAFRGVRLYRQREVRMIASILYLLGGLVEVLVGLRFIFRLVGANPTSPIVHWIYFWSTPFVAPFAGIFGQSPTVTVTGPGLSYQAFSIGQRSLR